MKIVELDYIKKLESLTNETKSYIPIKTTDIIEMLKSEFDVGIIHSVSRTYHTVNFHRNDDAIVLENSYRKERAFMLSLFIGGMYIPLGLERVIHRGERAHEVNQLDAATIIEAIDSRKNSMVKMKEAPVTKSIEDRIMKMIFGNRKIDLKETENELSRDNLFNFLERVLLIHRAGNYLIIRSDKVRKGRVRKNMRYLIKLSNKLYKTIKEEYPFIFI